MKETFKLRSPLMVNGKERIDLTYDFDEITGLLWDDAVRRSQKGNNFNVAAFDYVFHKNLMFSAIIAVNPEIGFEDLDRVKGTDLQRICNVGATFMSGSLEESEAETSGEPTETIAKLSTPPSESSKK